MATNRALVTFQDGSTLEVEKGTTIYELSKMYQPKMEEKIVGAEIDNEVVNLDEKIIGPTTLTFIDKNSTNGYKLNKYGLEFVMEVALKEAFDNRFELYIDHSIANGIHVTVDGNRNFTLADAKILKNKMNEIIEADEIIQNINVEQHEAIKYFNRVKAPEKGKNIHNLTNDIVKIYKLRNIANYFYFEMPYSTGSLSKYNLVFLEDNKLVLLFPSPCTKFKLPEYKHYQNIIKCFEESKKWIRELETPFLSDLNEKISECKIEDLIMITETHFNNEINELVEDFIKSKAKFMMFAGPSSSGKTTTTKKIALQLRSKGYDTLVISVDDYFLEREESPKDENGNYDFECLECLDLKLLNKQLKDLINGKKVSMPTYNFSTGKKEYNKPPVKLGENQVILMEGLHCINDAMTPDIAPKLKYKVYLSPFIPLNIDRHNYISTTDLRLIRRIVRDNRSRATDVGKTIIYWTSVRDGEEKYIFPYINKVNKVLNTSLIYEVGVLKVFVEPLLYSVSSKSPAYNEARRLIHALKCFFPIPSDYVGDDSILREFIGKSKFENM